MPRPEPYLTSQYLNNLAFFSTHIAPGNNQSVGVSLLDALERSRATVYTFITF